MTADKKKTIKNVLKYVLLVVVLLLLLLPARYINSVYGYLPFTFALFMLLLSVVNMLIIRRSISVESDFADAQCTRGEAVRISLRVRNSSIFVCPKAETSLFISDIYGASDYESLLRFTMAARAVNDFSFDMDMTHIGVYDVGLKDLIIYDMFGIFKIKVPINGTFKVNVAPRIRQLDELVVSEDVLAESENDTKKFAVGGINYTGVREYEYGDSMKQIHWKLSAHSPTYMTKLNESNRQSDYVVILDFCAPDYDTAELMDVSDCIIETGVAALESLAHEDVAYSLIFADKNEEMQRVIPQNGYYTDIIGDFSVITKAPSPTYPDAVKLLLDEAALMNRSSNVVLISSKVTETLIQELINVKMQKRYPELFYIIPRRLNERERETLLAPLENLHDAGITYHTISTAINFDYEKAEKGEEA